MLRYKETTHSNLYSWQRRYSKTLLDSVTHIKDMKDQEAHIWSDFLWRELYCVSLILQGREGWEYHLLNPNPERGILKRATQYLNTTPMNLGGHMHFVFRANLGNINRQRLAQSGGLWYGNWVHPESEQRFCAFPVNQMIGEDSLSGGQKDLSKREAGGRLMDAWKLCRKSSNNAWENFKRTHWWLRAWLPKNSQKHPRKEEWFQYPPDS